MSLPKLDAESQNTSAFWIHFFLLHWHLSNVIGIYCINHHRKIKHNCHFFPFFANPYPFLLRAVTSSMGGTNFSLLLSMEDSREYPIATKACWELTCDKLETNLQAIDNLLLIIVLVALTMMVMRMVMMMRAMMMEQKWSVPEDIPNTILFCSMCYYKWHSSPLI